LVEFADHGDELDYADWLNARLIKWRRGQIRWPEAISSPNSRAWLPCSQFLIRWRQLDHRRTGL